jgi:hypothetical protein
LHREKKMPGPWKPPTYDQIGTYTQYNYEFLDRVFNEGPGEPDPGIRHSYRNYDANQLRQHIQSDLHLAIPNNVKVAVFDVELAHFTDPQHIQFGSDTYYIMVLPPYPRLNPGNAVYQEDQTWLDAWYHASVDGYGM